MRTARRFVNDESGMTMALAIIMIVLIGVMGAGLLTFVSRDLNIVAEENRGQRAFEVADAGIGAAKGQLATSVDRMKYDDPDSASPPDNIQWAKTRGGLTLNNLDGEGATSDSVNVTIQYFAAANGKPEYFKVISTGNYENATRKIEAIFKGVTSNAGVADALGHPLYYTPSNIKIEGTDERTQDQVELRDISLFSGGDILVQDEDSEQFICDMSTSAQGVLGGTGNRDALENWYSPEYPVNQGRGPWNTERRKENSLEGLGHTCSYSGMDPSRDLLQPGLAAAGRICRWSPIDNPPSNPIGACPPTSPSIADGVYAYDCTTGPVDLPDAVCPNPPSSRGNDLTFVDKQPQDKALNDPDTITFPFPRPTPIPKGLHDDAVTRSAANPRTGATLTCTSNPCNPDFRSIFQDIRNPKLVFVDANGSTVNFNATGNPEGVLVVWCGRLVQQSQYTGIILNLYGDGSSFSPPSSNCSGDATKGTYRNAGTQMSGWVYAGGGTAQQAGIEIGPGSTVRQYPGATWSLLNTNQFQGPPPSSFALEGWRELYQ